MKKNILLIILIGLIGCEKSTVPRPTDPKPVVEQTTGFLKEGIGEAGFALDTSRDQGHYPRIQTGLIVIAQYGNTKIH